MLIRFTVDNFLSFNSEQEFSMNTGRATTFDHRVAKMPSQSILKFSALYGANASGKTNLVKAIDFSRKIIVQGISEFDTSGKHYKLQPGNEALPTKFEYDIKIGGTCYGYGFTMNLQDKKILNEWLVELKDGEDLLIYEREAATNYKAHNIYFSNPQDEKKFGYQMELVNDIETVLLISELSRRKNNPKELGPVEEIYQWFKNKLLIIYPDSPSNNMTNVFRQSDEQLSELLQYFDTGITGYERVPSSFNQIQQYLPKAIFDELKEDITRSRDQAIRLGKEQEVIGRGTVRLDNHLFEIEFKCDGVVMNEILFKHDDSDVKFTFGEESDGTRRLIELLDVIYNDANNRTVIIDELDRNLHPQMTIKFVETFLKYSQNLNTQLIITTHESNLMDLQLLRRDEIWFVSRDPEYNESRLYSLEKFKVHNTKKVAKDYLIGRYGAIPVFKDFGSYLSSLNDHTKI